MESLSNEPDDEPESRDPAPGPTSNIPLRPARPLPPYLRHILAATAPAPVASPSARIINRSYPQMREALLIGDGKKRPKGTGPYSAVPPPPDADYDTAPRTIEQMQADEIVEVVTSPMPSIRAGKETRIHLHNLFLQILIIIIITIMRCDNLNCKGDHDHEHEHCPLSIICSGCHSDQHY